MRRLRVLSAYPGLGKPNDVVDEFEGAQAYVDAGLAEWAPPLGEARVSVDGPQARVELIETTADVRPIETTSRRPAGRSRAGARTPRKSTPEPGPGVAAGPRDPLARLTTAGRSDGQQNAGDARA